jgi:hypothetical protein
MGQRLFIQMRRQQGLKRKQIHLKLLKLCSGEALSYADVR